MSDDHEDLIGDVGDDRGGLPPGDWTLPERVQEFRDTDPELRRFWMRQLVEIDPEATLYALTPSSNLRDGARVADLLREKQARHEAEELWLEMQHGGAADIEPPIVLTDFLAEPDDPVQYRVDGLWPTGGRVVLAAQNKSGKTTLVGNIVRSLADGKPFLDTFNVEEADRIVLIDNELSPGMVRRWLREQSVAQTDRVEVVTLRGRLSTFNILDPTVRSQWASAIGEADVLIFDCLRPALDALGLSEDKESGRFLEALDELTAEAGIRELMLVHHMGHSNERSRGDSRLEDWPDAKWKLVRDDPMAPDSARYFSAFGRDVDQDEVRLAYTHENRHLSVDGGSRQELRFGQLEAEVFAYVNANPGCSQREIEDGVSGDRLAVRRAAKSLKASGSIVVEKVGQKHAHTAVFS